MNVQYLKYVVEVANSGSISKAAEKLYVAQPNLSRAIKELESELNVTIFHRTSHGVILTADGEQLVNYGKTILATIDEAENLFKSRSATKSVFSVSVPRADYVGYAFSQFTSALSELSQCEVYYKETNALRAINNIVHADYKLGVIRYNAVYDKYFKDMLEQKGLTYELIAEFDCVLLLSANSRVASVQNLSEDDLVDLVEVAHADPFAPFVSGAEVRKTELPAVKRRIFVFERASQLEVLSQNAETYMWTSPLPEQTLERYNLVQIPVKRPNKRYKDVLIYKNDYVLTELDRKFITELCLARRLFLG